MKNFIWVSSGELEESLLNYCGEATVDYVAEENGRPVLVFTAKPSCAKNMLAMLNWLNLTHIRRKEI